MVESYKGNIAADAGNSVSGNSATIFEYMRLRAAESRYLDKDDEWQIIDNAVFQLGLRPADAKSYLVGAAVCSGFSTESLVRRTLLDIARGIRNSSRSVSKQKFEFMVDSALSLANNEISKEAAEALVKDACESASLSAKRVGLLRSRQWFRRAGSAQQQNRAD